MSRSPSIVPREADQDIYVVLDDFVGAWLGRAWRETDEEDTDRETLIRDLMEGQYSHPARIVAFNTRGMVARRDGRYRRRAATALCRVRRGATFGAGVRGD